MYYQSIMERYFITILIQTRDIYTILTPTRASYLATLDSLYMKNYYFYLYLGTMSYEFSKSCIVLDVDLPIYGEC